MPKANSGKFTLNDLRAARGSGDKLAMLTCYDYTTARLMDEAGVPMLLVGDSAGNVILGHDSTLAVDLEFLITLTGAVRRGAPRAFVVADMPFGSYQSSTRRGADNVFAMVRRTGADCIKLEVSQTHLRLIERVAGAGVAVMAHLGLRPQAVGLMGGYKTQGRTASQAGEIVDLARQVQDAGAAAILLEAVPPPVARAVIDAVELPVIGCGAGPDCHGHVIVTHDALNLTDHAPKFVPRLADIASPLRAAFALYVQQIADGRYPGPEHGYTMAPREQQQLRTSPVRIGGVDSSEEIIE